MNIYTSWLNQFEQSNHLVLLHEERRKHWSLPPSNNAIFFASNLFQIHNWPSSHARTSEALPVYNGGIGSPYSPWDPHLLECAREQ
jgi:hypothetical protein